MTTRISTLPSLATVTATTVIPVVDSGATKRVTAAALATYITGTVVSSVTAPAGSNTQIQFNNSGAFGATSNFTWENGTTVGVGGLGSPSTYGDGAYGFVAYGGSTANTRGHISLGGNNTTAGEAMGKIHFFNSNSTNAIYRVCAIQAIRGVDNNSGHLVFQTANSGAPSEVFRLSATGAAVLKGGSTTATGAGLCEPGYACPAGSTTSTGSGITNCPISYFSGTGKGPCLPCPPNMTTTNTGSVNITSCIASPGYYGQGIPCSGVNQFVCPGGPNMEDCGDGSICDHRTWQGPVTSCGSCGYNLYPDGN